MFLKLRVSETFVVFHFRSSDGFTYSIDGSLVLAGVVGHGNALGTALVRRNPQTLALTGGKGHASLKDEELDQRRTNVKEYGFHGYLKSL